MFKSKFQDRINTLIKRSGLNASDLARRAGISPTTMTYYTSGKRCPDAQTLYKLCSTFGVSADYLLGLADERTTDLDYKAAINKLKLSEDAADTLVRYAGPILNFFLSDEKGYWQLIYSDLRQYYACREHINKYSSKAAGAEPETVLFYEDDPNNPIIIDVNLSACYFARLVGDSVTKMLENSMHDEEKEVTEDGES